MNCIVADSLVYLNPDKNDSLFVYIRKQSGRIPTYFYVPNINIDGIGVAGTPKMTGTGYSFNVTSKPVPGALESYHVRGLTIPKNSVLPDTLDMTKYKDVAKFFGLSN